MSVNSYLTSLASELVISTNEVQSINTSVTTLSSRLTTYFGSNIKGHFKFGSSTRETILPRKVDSDSDIDYMVVFDTSGGELKPQTYLDQLRRFVKAKYSTSEVKQSHPTIILSLNHIHFELVPALEQFWSGYRIPSPASSWNDWMDTDPTGFNQKLISANTNNNSLIKPLVRLVKYWNVNNGRHFASYSLEECICNKNFWMKTSLNNYFYEFWSAFYCTYDTPQYIKDKVDRAIGIVETAKNYEIMNCPIFAEQEIKKLFTEL